MIPQWGRPTVFIEVVIEVPGPTTLTPREARVHVSIPVDATGAVSGTIERLPREPQRKATR